MRRCHVSMSVNFFFHSFPFLVLYVFFCSCCCCCCYYVGWVYMVVVLFFACLVKHLLCAGLDGLIKRYDSPSQRPRMTNKTIAIANCWTHTKVAILQEKKNSTRRKNLWRMLFVNFNVKNKTNDTTESKNKPITTKTTATPPYTAIASRLASGNHRQCSTEMTFSKFIRFILLSRTA